jgi:hypothetical protein
LPLKSVDVELRPASLIIHGVLWRPPVRTVAATCTSRAGERDYAKRSVPDDEAVRRAWATVNKETHGGKKSGSGRGKPEDHSPARKGGHLAGKAAASRPASERSCSAKKAAKTRKVRAA